MDVASNLKTPDVLLVSSSGEWAGLALLPRMFQRCGAKLTVLAPRDTGLRRSRYVKTIQYIPSGYDALVPALREHLAKHQYDMVILGDEPAVVTVSHWAAKNPDDCAWIDSWFPIDRRNGVDLVVSKAAFTDACQTAGLPVPRSITCHNYDQLSDAADEVGYPLALKTANGFGGNGVIRVNNARELPDAYDRLKHRAPLVIQEFVAGRIGTTQLVLDRGRVLYWMPTFVTKCCPEPYGPSCVRVFLDEKDLAAMRPIVEGVAKMTNFRGICGIDWIQRPDGSFVLLELNPRPTPAMELGRFAGVDCGKAVRSLLLGGAAAIDPQPVSGKRKTVYLFPQHVQRSLCYHKYSDLLYWLPFVAAHDVPWCEPRLMASYSWRLLRLASRIMWQKVTPWVQYKRPVSDMPGEDARPIHA
jgi:hypothetical protein